MNLLIVNDEIIAAKGVKQGIDWQKYEITFVDMAFEAETAREKLLTNQFDILLCDIEMPGESGIQLVQWIRTQKMDIEVIFLTCHADFEFAQEAIRLECRNYILLPTTYAVIAENIYNVVLEIEKKREAEKQQQYGKLWMAEKEKESSPKTISSSPEKTVESIEEYIDGHFTEADCSLRLIAAKMYMNADYLNRVYKRETGRTVGQYIVKKRMEFAKNLLLEKKFNASQIAEMAGYNSYSSFVTSFKNYYDCSPSHYVKYPKET